MTNNPTRTIPPSHQVQSSAEVLIYLFSYHCFSHVIYYLIWFCLYGGYTAAYRQIYITIITPPINRLSLLFFIFEGLCLLTSSAR